MATTSGTDCSSTSSTTTPAATSITITTTKTTTASRLPQQPCSTFTTFKFDESRQMPSSLPCSQTDVVLAAETAAAPNQHQHQIRDISPTSALGTAAFKPQMYVYLTHLPSST